MFPLPSGIFPLETPLPNTSSKKHETGEEIKEKLPISGPELGLFLIGFLRFLAGIQAVGRAREGKTWPKTAGSVITFFIVFVTPC